MEPVVIGAGAYGALRVFNACARGTQDATKTVGYARTKFRLLGSFSVSWLDPDFQASASTTGFTAEQLEDIGHFLSAPSIRPILALLAIANLTDEVDQTLLNHVEEAFLSEAKRWNSTNKKSWNKHAASIWKRLKSLHQEMLPSSEAAAAGWQDDIEYYEDFVNTPLQKSAGPGNYRARFVSQLISLATDVSRLHTAFDSSANAASIIAATTLDPIITHTELGIGRTPTFASLYVDRNFVDMSGEVTLDSTILTSSETPFRIILTGAPGAGKTTYTQHFRYQMAQQQAKPVFTVRCREYAATNWDRIGLIDFALDRHNAEYSDQLEHSTIRDMLILGRAVIMLDGLDEVTDPLRRVELVRRINALTAHYPLASMLITSREVGYDRAPVDQALFTRVHLREFSVEQTLKYARKWFGFVGRNDLVDRFMHDSESIPDIRLNPLMLSLLCLLYRESGSIPSRRLGIYSECARLLFHRWDSHRQIQVDGAIPDFSDDLMQEIARWFYTSTTAQAGLDETVITGMLKRILIDQSGFPEGKAAAAAADFLEFCAGRAWLLGSIGSNHRGERLFAFTHKTFYEYFAAESFARNATEVKEICARIQAVFANDSSSVLPELLIQSYGKHSSQGAVRIMKELGHSASPLLLLRLIEGVTLPAHSRELVFFRLAELWKKGRQTSNELIAILQLNPLAREQFLSEHLQTGKDLRRKFLSGWAAIELAGLGSRYSTSWQPTIDKLLTLSPVKNLDADGTAIWHWRALSNDIEGPDSALSLLVAESEFGRVPGVAWFAVEQKLRRGRDMTTATTKHMMAVVEALDGGAKFPADLLSAFSEALQFGGSPLTWTINSASAGPSDQYFHLFAYVALALNEYGACGQGVNVLWAGFLRDVVEVRRLKRAGVEPDEELIISATAVTTKLPPRLRKWMLNRTKLVTYST